MAQPGLMLCYAHSNRSGKLLLAQNRGSCDNSKPPSEQPGLCCDPRGEYGVRRLAGGLVEAGASRWSSAVANWIASPSWRLGLHMPGVLMTKKTSSWHSRVPSVNAYWESQPMVRRAVARTLGLSRITQSNVVQIISIPG